MPQLSTPHDEFFKKVFSRQDAARSFLKHYLPPDITSLLDLDDLTIAKDSFVDDELRSHHSDILYNVALQDGNRSAHVYVLFEHKSYPDREVSFQLLRYMMRIWEQRRGRQTALHPIFPVVVCHGKTKWRYPLDFASLIENLPEEMQPYIPDYSYQLCDLSQYSDEAIIGTVHLQIVLLLLKYALRGEFWEKLPSILHLFVELLRSERQTALAYFETMLRYISAVRKDKSDAEMRDAVREAFPAGGEVMETILERWAERGFQRGLQQGKQEGIRQERLHSLLDSIAWGLELKFGVEGLRILPEIRKIEDVDVLLTIREGLKLVDTLAELRHLYQEDIPNAAPPQVHEETASYTGTDTGTE